jgi:polyhydroxybutyrate depolymerase
MKSRFLIGAVMLASVGAVVGGAAAAQRGGERGQLIERLRQHAAERRAKAPADTNMTRITRPGDYRFSLTHGGITREYLVHVPRSYNGGPAPLLIALHGGGGDADFQANDKNYGLITKSEQAGFIAVFPSGYSRMPSGILATWNAGRCCGKAVEKNIDDVGFVREVIARMQKQVRIDARRIVATGMSNGAMLSWRLACEAPEIRAIAPVAGTDNTTRCNPAHPVPVIQFHAVDDDHVPFNGGKGDLSMVKVDFTSVAASQAKWVGLDRANPAAKRVLSVTGAHCDLHAAKPGGAPVELCVTDSGGHSWPGAGGQRGRKQPSMAINANDLMWNFFSSL